MAGIALGRQIVLERQSLPVPARFDSTRIIPVEPDEVWDAIAIRIRISTLKAQLATATGVRGIGLAKELRRDDERLGLLLERIGLDNQQFEDRMNDTPPVVNAVKIATLGLDEKPGFASLESPDDLVVSVRGRGFNFMSSLLVRGDYTNAAGEARTMSLNQTRESVDLEFLEYSALAPLSHFDVAVGSVVTLIMVSTMRSGRRIERAFERFTVA